MERIREFLVAFGEGLSLEILVDEVGNVLIIKPATAGLENRQRVVLRAHMDMMPQVADGVAFDNGACAPGASTPTVNGAL